MLKPQYIFQISLLLHIIVPFFSTGFLHPDEYYYVLDFSFDKLGMISDGQKSWEHQAQIRSWTLPGFFVLFGHLFQALGLKDPFYYTLLYRLLSSLVAFSCHVFFVKTIQKRYGPFSFKHLEALFLLSWPLLLMHSRTNTENWSTSLLILTLCLHLLKRYPFLEGLLLCLAFFVRFQIGLFFLPMIFLWRKRKIPDLIFIGLGFCFMGVGLFSVDFWGYDQWTLTPWNYFKTNLVEGKVNHFGTHSPFYYFTQTLTKLLPLWGLALIMAFLYALKKVKTHLLFKEGLSFLSLFILIHHLIGHKELRFLYPALPIGLLFLSFYMKSWKPSFLKFFWICNFLAFPILFIPRYKPIYIYRYLYSHASQIPELHYLTPQNPLELKSFISPQIKMLPYHKKEGEQFVLIQNYEHLKKIKKEKQCIYRATTYPAFLIEKNPLGLLKRSNIWSILQCH